jgi:hypothetical protein
MRTTLKIILPFIGKLVPAEIDFDRREEILPRREKQKRRTIHRRTE